jgi:hypothetical protein
MVSEGFKNRRFTQARLQDAAEAFYLARIRSIAQGERRVPGEEGYCFKARFGLYLTHQRLGLLEEGGAFTSLGHDHIFRDAWRGLVKMDGPS